ncbi:MAG: TonB-dependent receptor [Bacteroidales bacterium]
MRICFTLLGFWLLTALYGQDIVKISGQVTNSEGEPIEVAHVRLKSGVIGTLTDFKGKYELSVPASDSVTIVYSCLGFKRVTRLLLNPQGKTQLNVRLYSNAEALGEVEVTANRIQANTLEKIALENSRLMPDASGGSVESLLTTFAGVNSSNELSSQYSVRGGNFDENIVYVNGIEVYRPQLVRSGQQEGLSFINPDMVGSIGFSSGGYAAEYGDKMASVLDITYKKPERFEGSLSASLLGGSVAVGQAVGRFTQLHGFRFKQNSNLLSSLDTKGEYNPTFFDYQTYLTYRIADQWDVSLLGNISQNKYQFRPESRTTSFGTLESAKQFTVYFDGQEKDLFRTFFGAATLSYRGISRTTLDLLISAFATDEQETYDITGEYWLDDVAEENAPVQGSLGVGSYHEHARNKLNARVLALAVKGVTKYREHQFAYGVNVQSERIKDRINEWEMRDSSGYSLPNTGEHVELIYSLHSKYNNTTTRMGGFIQDTYRFNAAPGRFILTAGARASYWSYNREFIISPRASIALVPENRENVTLRFATGLYYQTPFYKEYRDTIRDADDNLVVRMNDRIKSQRAIHFVLGGDYSFRSANRPFKLTTELYYKKLDNLIPYEVDNVRIRYYGDNLAKGYATGLDVKFFGEFVPGTDSWFSFSLMRARETFNGVTMPRPTEQRYSFGLYFNDFVPKFPKYKMSLKAIWSDGLPFGSPDRGRPAGVFRTTPYRRVDIGLSRMLSGDQDRIMNRGKMRYIKSIWLGLDVFNLLDISNVNSYYWVTSVNDQQYAVPNYLTGRQINLRLSLDF